MAVLAAAAFTTSTAAAQADVMTAGTWDGKISGGTLSLGDGDLQQIDVPEGDAFTFTIPAGATTTVPFKAPATHIAIPRKQESGSGTEWAVAGSLDVSPIAGTVDPATGAVTGTASAQGLLRLDLTPTSGPTSSLYCHLGDPAAPPADPAPFALSLAGTAAAGSATLTSAPFTVSLDCGVPIAVSPLPVIGDPLVPGSALSLTATFTRRPDPTPPAVTTPTKPTTTTTTPPKALPTVVKCIVPKLKGMKLKKARKAAKKAGCTVGKIKRKKSARRKTTVLKQGAAVGAILAEGARIKLTVAK
jgi:hypothetical protein